MIDLKSEYNRNNIKNYVFRITTIILGLVLVKVNIKYLGDSLYGLWVTIASVISWMSSGDFGIGNGLRNELAKAYGEGDKQKQNKLIATASATLAKVAIVLFVVILLLCEILFRTKLLSSEVRYPMYITGAFFCINLCLGIAQSIAYSFQKSWLTTFSNCLVSCFSVVVILLLISTNVSADLVLFAMVNGICTTIPNIILIFILKHQGINIFKAISSKNIDKNLRGSIMNAGLKFFGLQICSIVLYSTDNLIINYLISSEMVTKYSIITKIYDTGSSLFAILLISLWSAVTFHIAQNDYEWVRKKIKNLLKIWLVFAIGVIIVSLLFNFIVSIWLGEEAVYYEPELVILFGVYCLITTFSAIFVNILNGAGAIRLQLIIAIIGAVINIPLSVIFARELGMGIFGIKLATFISAAFTAIFMPIQAILLLRKNKNIENQ